MGWTESLESLKAKGIYLFIHITPMLGTRHTSCTYCMVPKKLGSSFRRNRKLRKNLPVYLGDYILPFLGLSAPRYLSPFSPSTSSALTCASPLSNILLSGKEGKP